VTGPITPSGRKVVQPRKKDAGKPFVDRSLVPRLPQELAGLVDERGLMDAVAVVGKTMDSRNVEAFSGSAMTELLRSSTDHFRSVAHGSVMLAAGQGLDAVSADHVKAAIRQQRQGRRKAPFREIAIALGGVLLGAGLPELVTLVSPGQVTSGAAVLFTVTSMVAGSVFFCLGFWPRPSD
jgi:hypothetical protein